MFVFDPTFGNSFEKCESEIRRLMDRAQAEILFCRKWDERRLAYRIKGRKRGVYVLVYFNAPPDRIVSLERDAKLAEHILRLLVVRADGVTPEQMESVISARGGEQIQTAGGAGESARPGKAAETPVAKAEQTDAPASTDTAGVPRPKGEPVETE
jgi:small subunit ribosomal protein S6